MKARAVAMTAQEQAELAAVEVPESVGPDEVQGASIVTLVSPGTELAANFCGKSFPNYPGYAALFRAERMGAEVNGALTGAGAGDGERAASVGGLSFHTAGLSG